MTLEEFLHLLGKVLQVDSLKFKEGSRKIFPSVDCGPIDITKDVADLGLAPTPLVRNSLCDYALV